VKGARTSSDYKLGEDRGAISSAIGTLMWFAI
jgi:hypothetical protein